MTEEAFTVIGQLLMLHVLIGTIAFASVAYLLGKPKDGYAALFWVTATLASPCVLLVLFHLAPESLGFTLAASTFVHLLLGTLWARDRWASLRGELYDELRAWEVGALIHLPDGLRREADGSFAIHLEDHAETVAWWVGGWFLSVPNVVCGAFIGKVRQALYDRLQELAER